MQLVCEKAKNKMHIHYATSGSILVDVIVVLRIG